MQINDIINRIIITGKLDNDAINFLRQNKPELFPEMTDQTEESVLDAYAENIYNYVYNYKPEAQEIDPTIDPSEDQIGPMAQDIEKVNPACIIETEDGVKTVDINKLALMNAGAIAELTREVNTLKQILLGDTHEHE